MDTNKHNPETKGRKFNTIRWGIHSRRKSPQGNWIGTYAYTSEEEARAAFNRAISSNTSSIEVGKGIWVDTSVNSEFEFRLVKQVAEIEVLEVGTGLC